MKCTVSIFPVYKLMLKGEKLLTLSDIKRVPLLKAVQDETQSVVSNSSLMNLDLCTLAVSPLTICQFVTP